MVQLNKIAFEQADVLAMGNHEIIKIISLNQKLQTEWIAPRSLKNSDWISKTQNDQVASGALNSTIELSKTTGRAAFSKFITLDLPGQEPLAREGSAVFWQVVPNFIGGEPIGYLAVLYSTQGILDVVPSDLKAHYRFTLLTDDERVLSISSDRDTPKRALSNQTSLDIGVLSPNLTLLHRSLHRESSPVLACSRTDHTRTFR